MRNVKDKLPKQGGFTIIEVVLVLAIAGLIFLIVFLALPQLQESRRDTQRRSDAGRFLAAMENYAGNSNGAYPTEAAVRGAGWLTQNVSDPFNDPSTGGTYTFAADQAAILGASATPGQILYLLRAECNTDGSPGAATGAPRTIRQIAVIFKLENGVFCQDNQ